MTFWDAFGASKKAKTGVFGQKTGVFWSLRPEFDIKNDSEMVQNDPKGYLEGPDLVWKPFIALKQPILTFSDQIYFFNKLLSPLRKFPSSRNAWNQQSDARSPRDSWGTGKLLQKHTGIASELYWNRLDMF